MSKKGWKITKPRSQQAKDLASKRMKTLWASGRHPSQTPEARAKAAQELHETHISGRAKKVPTEIRRKVGAMGFAARSKAEIMKTNRRVGQLNRGGTMPPGPAAKGEGHWKAKYWKIRSPYGEAIEGKNLNEIVRRNSHLFDPEDLEWNKASCRASKGIRQLFEGKRNNAVSWKGWTAMLDHHDDTDPLSRQSFAK